MTERPRIAIAGFQHESNSFSPFGATWNDFVMADGWPALTTGSAMLNVFPSMNIPLGGFAAACDFDLVPIAWCSAEPSGPVADNAFERMSAIVCVGLQQAGPLDGIYLDLHGAMVTESHEDGEGELLARIRAVVGPNLPLVASLDMHANVTEAMVAQTDAMTIYRTYPHIDMAETGARCIPLLRARLASEPVYKAFRKLPYLLPLSSQSTDTEPFRSIFRRLPGFVGADVLSADIAAGFPPADIRECGPSVVVYGRSQAAADRCADELLALLMEAEPDFRNELVPARVAVADAIAGGRGPVVLADAQDNPGAGGTSDTTTILRELVEARAQKAAVSVVWDREAARIAHAAGIGAEIEIQLGSRYGYDAQPFKGRFVVEQLSDGNIVGTGAIVGGATMALGPMACLRVAGTDVRVIVSSVRFQCLDQALFRGLGVEPTEQDILVVKSTIHFRADFEPIAKKIVLVECPGAHPCRIDLGAYERLRPGVRVPNGLR